MTDSEVMIASQRINRLRDYFWNAYNSVIIYQIINLYLYDTHVSNDEACPSKKFMSNWSIEKLHETNFQVIGIVIRCVRRESSRARVRDYDH